MRHRQVSEGLDLTPVSAPVRATGTRRTPPEGDRRRPDPYRIRAGQGRLRGAFPLFADEISLVAALPTEASATYS